jgi:hypothetical protein
MEMGPTPAAVSPTAGCSHGSAKLVPQMGPWHAFIELEVQKALKLTGEQKEKIKTIAADAAQERRELFQGGVNIGQGGANRDGEEAQKKMTALRKATVEKVSAVLTDDQKQTWKGMIGQPFEVQFQARRNS